MVKHLIFACTDGQKSFLQQGFECVATDMVTKRDDLAGIACEGADVDDIGMIHGDVFLVDEADLPEIDAASRVEVFRKAVGLKKVLGQTEDGKDVWDERTAWLFVDAARDQVGSSGESEPYTERPLDDAGKKRNLFGGLSVLKHLRIT